MQQCKVCLVSEPEIWAQMPDIYRCIRPSRDRLNLYAEIQINSGTVYIHNKERSVSLAAYVIDNKGMQMNGLPVWVLGIVSNFRDYYSFMWI